MNTENTKYVTDDNDEDCREPFSAFDAAEYLRSYTGIAFTAQTLATLLAVGRGPVCDDLSTGTWYRRQRLKEWFHYHFGSPKPNWDPVRLGEKVRWLVIGRPSPDMVYLRNHFRAWGCEASCPFDDVQEAAKLAGQGGFSAAYLELDGNLEAAVVIAELLAARHIPYLFLSNVLELPRSIARTGIILRRPLGDIDYVRREIKWRMPREIVSRMDLDRQTNVVWHGIDWKEEQLRRECKHPQPWTERSEEEYKRLLVRFGMGDKGKPDLRNLNYHLLQFAECCVDEPKALWDYHFKHIVEDWLGVLWKAFFPSRACRDAEAE